MEGNNYGRFHFNGRMDESPEYRFRETDAEWEALKHKIYAEAIPVIEKVEIWYMEDSPYRCCSYSIDCRYYVGIQQAI